MAVSAVSLNFFLVKKFDTCAKPQHLRFSTPLRSSEGEKCKGWGCKLLAVTLAHFAHVD